MTHKYDHVISQTFESVFPNIKSVIYWCEWPTTYLFVVFSCTSNRILYVKPPFTVVLVSPYIPFRPSQKLLEILPKPALYVLQVWPSGKEESMRDKTMIHPKTDISGTGFVTPGMVTLTVTFCAKKAAHTIRFNWRTHVRSNSIRNIQLKM